MKKKKKVKRRHLQTSRAQQEPYFIKPPSSSLCSVKWMSPADNIIGSSYYASKVFKQNKTQKKNKLWACTHARVWARNDTNIPGCPH